MKSKLILFALLLNICLVYSQKANIETISYHPANGFQMDIPFKWGFIDCHGIGVQLAIERVNKEVTSSGYYYKNKLYTSAEIGTSRFRDMKSYIGQTDIVVDIYFGVNRVGTTDLNNITGVSGCAFGTYDVLKSLGNGKEYAKKIKSLSIRSLRDLKVQNRHPGIEADIEDYLKNNQIKKLLNRADRMFYGENYGSAETDYRNVLKLDYSNEIANKRLEEIKQIKRKKLKKEEFESFISEGDYFYEHEEYSKAIENFKQAHKTGFDDELSISKIDMVKEKLEEIANSRKPQTEENKKAEIDRKPNEGKTNSLAIIKSTNKEPTEIDKKKEEDRQKRIDQKIKDDIDYYHGRRETKKALEEERKRKEEAAIYGVAKALSSIPEADSYTSTIGLSYSLNYVNNINLVLREGWVWGYMFLDMKFAGVVVPTKGWENEGNRFTRSELQNYTNNNEINPLDIIVRYSDSYDYYKYNENVLGYGGGMGLAFGFTFPVANSFVLRVGATADAELTNLYIKSAYGFETEFCVGKWLIGLGYQTSDYSINDSKVIFNDPELTFSHSTTYGLKTVSDIDQIESFNIKNHFVIKLAYAW